MWCKEIEELRKQIDREAETLFERFCEIKPSTYNTAIFDKMFDNEPDIFPMATEDYSNRLPIEQRTVDMIENAMDSGEIDWIN